MRHSSKGSWQLPQLLLQCNNKRKWLTRLLRLLRDGSSRLNLLGLNNRNRWGLKVKQNHIHQIEKSMRREAGIKSSSPPLNKPHLPQNPGPTLSTASPATPRHSRGRKVGPFCGTMGRIDRQQVGPLYRPKQVQDPIQVSANKSESIFLPVIARRNRGASWEMGSEKGSESGNFQFLFPESTSHNRLFLAKSLYTQTTFQNGVRGFSQN